MNSKQQKLVDLLKVMFQFDQADLDFGIYRIMNIKREEINDYLNNKLINQVTEEINKLIDTENESKIKEIEQQMENTKKSNLSDNIKEQAISEFEKQIKQMNSSNISDVEGEVYSHLINFFSRYYDDGDFISQRRYKDGAYAIPYEGEEVKFYWANEDQYYIKTSEYFTDYSFKNAYGDVINFKIVNADTEIDNIKSGEKKFFQLNESKHFEIEEKHLTVYFQYKAGEEKKKQETYNKEIYEVLKKELSSYKDYSSMFATQNSKDKSIFEKQLYRYTAKNTFDYFIHKDLKKFLQRELDFYIKNEVIFVDDLSIDDMNKTKECLVKAKVIKNVATKVIEFLAQIEEFEKKIYLKKKFVVDTNYCITLDRVPEEMYPDIINNKEQINEWIKLFAIDEINGKTADTVCYSNPLTIEFLKQNSFLSIDTKFFDNDFKEKLISSIDNLDDNLNGLLIKGDNIQALRLLEKKFNKQIDCVYIDPPYNAKSSEILYKNNFKDSSWLSMMNDRLISSKPLLKEEFVYNIAIDENEQELLGQLITNDFPDNKKACLSIVKACITVVHNPRGQQGKNIAYSHEFNYMIYPEGQKKYLADSKRDEIGSKNLRKNGSESNRTDGANCFYPIICKNNEIIEIGKVPAPDFHPKSSNVIKKDGTIEVWPIDDDGNEKKWRYATDSIHNILNKLEVKDVQGIKQIYFNKDIVTIKSVWNDAKFDASEYGTKVLQDLFGDEYVKNNASNLYPKSIFTELECINASLNGKDTGIVMDFFAGSGTTGEAIIRYNSIERDDTKVNKIKYILCEMGDHFETITKPRIEKNSYSKDWKKGTPISRKGVSQAFKYIRLESYEDALNNIELTKKEIDFLPEEMKEQYLLKYMLEDESKESVFNVDKLAHPFNYAMKITKKQQTSNEIIDLVESFNYFIGLIVEKSYAKESFDADFYNGEYGITYAKLKEGNNFSFKIIEGHSLQGDKILVIWRDLTDQPDKDNAVLEAYLKHVDISLDNDKYSEVYINGDCTLQNKTENSSKPKIKLIEEEIKNKMFE